MNFAEAKSYVDRIEFLPGWRFQVIEAMECWDCGEFRIEVSYQTPAPERYSYALHVDENKTGVRHLELAADKADEINKYVLLMIRTIEDQRREHLFRVKDWKESGCPHGDENCTFGSGSCDCAR